MAAGRLAGLVTSFKIKALRVHLPSDRPVEPAAATAAGAFVFTLLTSRSLWYSDLDGFIANWSASGAVTNFGSADFTGPGVAPQKFFRAITAP
jgi:hypothetical protein